jgi:RNA polymerase sigma factor (sigma-70 family)
MVQSLHTDEQLVDHLRVDDRLAFEMIYKRYAHHLHSYIRRTLHDSDECKEIIQEIFESLWVRRHSVQIESLKAYLFTAARFLMAKYFRRARLIREYAEHFTLFEAAYESLPEHERDEEAAHDKLRRAIDGLADRCRVALQLRLDENLSYREIAERMNVTTGTVEGFIVKARNQLKAQLRIGDSR